MKYIKLCALLMLANIANGHKASFNIPYEKFTLPNGLQVIFHIDRSVPVVAVSLTAHKLESQKSGDTRMARRKGKHQRKSFFL